MKVCRNINETINTLEEFRKSGKTIGFVPTMGALHPGHLDLMKRAKDENDVLVVSIFVNPIQFNNPEDLTKYPRDLHRDKALLEKINCDVLFNPEVEEMYPEAVNTKYNFGALEKVMEGAFRAGHFNGVAIVVNKLLDITKPDRAYFGEKDYQQLAIIQKLVKMENIPVEIIPCPTVREKDGLAMSSRNERLTATERALAPVIFQALNQARLNMANMTPDEVKIKLKNKFSEIPQFKLEYFEIADDKELKAIDDWNQAKGIRGFIAAHLGNVRLIDNIKFI
jgi:pantoate--beta-alanine ligase